MKYDDILVIIGEFGTFQKRILALIVMAWICYFPIPFLSIFLLESPPHRCKIPVLQNDTYAVQTPYHEELITTYIPPGEDSQCYTIIVNQGDEGQYLLNGSLTKCSEWVYSRVDFEETFATKHNLVCDDSYKIVLTEAIYFVGTLVGSFTFGVISDCLGRKKTITITSAMLTFSSFSLALARDYITITLLQFCNGLFGIGLQIATYVAVMELVGPSKRPYVGLVTTSIAPIGGIYLTFVSYLLRQWQYISVAAAIPLLIFTFLSLFIPESPRWIVSRNQKITKDARKIIEKVAVMNRRTLPKNFFTNNEFTEENETSYFKQLWLVLTTKVLLLRSLIISFTWFTLVLSYYGTSYHSGSLYGDFFVNNFVSILVEFPAAIAPLILINRFGRKKTLCPLLFLSGLSCLCTILTIFFLPEDLQTVTTIMAMVGRCGITAAVYTFFIYSVELFPTVVRNSAFGLSFGFARVGSIVSPFVIKFATSIDENIGTAMPVVIIGILTLLAGILALWLPETLNQHLSDTIEEAINMNKNNNVKTGKENVQSEKERSEIEQLNLKILQLRLLALTTALTMFGNCWATAILANFFIFLTELLTTTVRNVRFGWCKIPELLNDTFAVHNPSHQELISTYIPSAEETNTDYSQCYTYILNKTIGDHSLLISNVSKCSEWVYCKEDFDETFATKHSLVCDDSYKILFTKTIYFLGMLVGSLTFGVMADRFGRKKTITFTSSLLTISTFSLALARDYFTFSILQFCNGAFCVGMLITNYVTVMELVGPSKRHIVGLITTIAGPIGGVYLTFVSFLLRNWQYITYATAVPILFCSILSWFLPESPRWILSRYKEMTNDARSIIEKTATVNGKPLPDYILKKNEFADENEISCLKQLRLLFTTKVFVFRCLNISFIWFTLLLSYYGLSYHSGSLYGNFYVNHFFSTLVEFPAALVPIILLNRLGRKKTFCTLMFISGVFCLCTILTMLFLPKGLQTVTTCIAMIGRCGVVAAVDTFYIYSMELFPTVVRNTGFGFCFAFGRIGSIVSPYVIDLAVSIDTNIGNVMPVVVMGILALLAGVSALQLPETLHQPLTDTIEDAINMEEGKLSKSAKDEVNGEISRY